MPKLSAPAKNPGTFPKKIHFAVIGQLTPVDVRNILIWKKYNPDYEVTLHRDSQSYLDQLKLQKVSEETLEINELRSIYNGAPSRTSSLPANTPWHDLDVELTLRIGDLRTKQKDMEAKVQAKRLASNTDRRAALIEELKSSYNVGRYDIEKILRKQSDLENALLSKDVAVIDFKDTLPESPASHPVKEYRGLYDQIAYTYNDFDLALKIMKNRILDKHGGLMIDTAATPEINTDIFSSGSGNRRPAVSGSDGSDGSPPLSYEQLLDVLKKRLSSIAASGTSPLPGPDAIIRNCVHQAFIEQLKHDLDNTPDRDYLEQLERSGYKELASAIKIAVQMTSPELFFKGLGGALPTRGADLSMVDNSRGLNASPLIIAAKPNAPALRDTIQIFALCYSVVTHDSSTDLLKAADVDSLADNNKQVRQALYALNFRLKNLHTVQNQSIEQREKLINQVKDVLSKLPYRGVYVPTDNLGYLMGREAMVITNTVNTPLNVEYSYHVDQGRNIKGVDLAGETSLMKKNKYDNRVIVSLSKDPGIWIENAEVFQRYPKSTYWLFWDRQQQLFFPQAGKPLPLTENSKLLLSGHGNKQGIEGHSLGEVADVVSKLLPAGGQVKRINLKCCTLDQEFIHVDPGPNLKSQKWLSKTFSGRLLESLAQKQNAILVGSVTFYNKSPTEYDFLGRSLSYYFGQSAPPYPIDPSDAYYETGHSYQFFLRKPESSVVEMQRAPDGTFTARTKEGNPLLFDDHVKKKQLTHVTPPDTVPRNLPSPGVIFSITWKIPNLLPYIDRGNVIVPADLDIIQFIFKHDVWFSNTFIAAGSGPKAEGLAFTLKAVRESKTYDEWIAKISIYYPVDGMRLFSLLALVVNDDSERERKFLRLDDLIRDNKIDVIIADLPSELDIVTGKYPADSIAYSLIPLSGTCNISSPRRRRSLSAGNCNWNFDKATDQLKLVAGHQIDLQLPDGTAKEIGLFEPKNRKLAELQTAIQGYRRRTAIANLANRVGQYAIIALDSSSFSAAKKMVGKLQGLLNRDSTTDSSKTVLRFRPGKNVLTSPDGRVVPLVGGGSTSRISLVGSPASFSAGRGVKCIKSVVNGGRVGQLDILVNTSAGSVRAALPDTQLKALSAVSDWLKVDTLSPAALSPVKGHTTFNSHSWQGHNEAFRQQLRDKTVSALPPASKQVSAGIDKKLEFIQIARDFSAWVDITLKSESSLNADYFPLLHTLAKTEDGQWHMDFIHKDTKDRQNLRITDKAPLRMKAYLERESPKPKQQGGGLRHSIKKALFKPARTSRFANEALSGVDHFQTLMSIIRRGSLLGVVSKTEGMSDGFYRSMVAETYVMLGMEVSQGVELVDELARLLKNHTRIGKMLPAETKVVKTFSRTGAPTRTLATTTRLTRYGKFMKPVKAIGKAAGPLGVALMGGSFGLSIYQYTQIEDKTIKDLYRDKVIVQGVMFGLTLALTFLGGPVGTVMAGAMLLGMFIAEFIFDAKLREIILKRKLEQATKVVEAFNDIYRQLDPEIYFPINNEIKHKALDVIRKILSNPGENSLLSIKKELKDIFKPVDDTMVDRIFKKMQQLRNIDTAKFRKALESFLKDEKLVLDERQQTIDFYSNPAAKKLFDLGLKGINLRSKTLDHGQMYFRDQYFRVRPGKNGAWLWPLDTYTEGVFEYVKSDCKPGKRLAAYQCTGGIFDVKGLMPDKISTIIMPARLDWSYDGQYTSFDDGRTVPLSDGRRFFDGFAHTKAKIKYFYGSKVHFEGFLVQGKKGFIIKQFDQVGSRHTDVKLDLDYQDLNLIFPPHIQTPTRPGHGLLYTLNVPDNSTNNYKLIIKDNWSIDIYNLNNAPSANFLLYYHGKLECECLNKYYWLYQGKNCYLEKLYHGFEVRIGGKGAKIYFNLPRARLSEESKKNIKITIVDDAASFVVRPYDLTRHIEVQSFRSKEPLYNSAARRTYFSEINTASSNRDPSGAIRKHPTPKPEDGRQYQFPGQFVPVILNNCEDHPVYEKMPSDIKSAQFEKQTLNLFTKPPQSLFAQMNLIARARNYYNFIKASDKSGINCYYPTDTNPVSGLSVFDSYVGRKPEATLLRLFEPEGSHVPLSAKNRLQLWYDRTNDVEIRFIRPEGSGPEHIVPVMGTPDSGYYVFDRHKRRLYFDQHAVLTKQRLNDYKKGNLNGLFTDTAHAFPHNIVSYHIIDRPAESTEKKLAVITENGAALILHGFSKDSSSFRYTSLYISATESSLRAALDEVASSDNPVTSILPVSIVKKAHSDQLLKSGFYHMEENLLTAYIASAVDFYGVNELKARCLANSNNGKKLVDLVQVSNDGEQYYLLSPAEGSGSGPGVHSADRGENDCFVNLRSKGTYLKMTPELSRSIKGDHTPVHIIFKGSATYYFMLSSLTEDIYYIRFEDVNDSKKLTEANQLNVLTFGSSSGNSLGNSLGKKIKDTGGFTDVRSLKNGILAYTRNGYILMIPNSTLLNSQRLASPPSDTYRHSGWHYSGSDTGESTFLQPENSTTKVIYYQLPNDSSIDLVGLDMGRLLSGLIASHFSGNNGTSVENWDQQQVSTFIGGLKAAVRAVYQQFKTDFEEDAPDLVKLPLVHLPENASLPTFFKQLDFWYLNSQDRLLAANASDEFRIVGNDAQSLMALKGEGESKPYRFFINPETVSTPTPPSTTQKTAHAYCRNHRVVSNLLPDVFHSDISVPCEYSDDSPTASYLWDRSEIQWEGRSSGGALFTLAEGQKTLSGLDFISGLEGVAQWKFYYGLYTSTSSNAYRKVRAALAGKISGLSLNSTDSPYYQYRKQALLTIDFAPASLKGPKLRNAWYDTQRQELILGPWTLKNTELSLIGRPHLNDYRQNKKYILCFDHERKRAYHINKSRAVLRFYDFSNIETDDKGQLIQVFGTTGNNTLNASYFLMETLYYDEGKYARSLSLTPESPHDLTLYLDGKGGADTFSVKNSDLAYFAQVIIKLEERAFTDHGADQATDHDSSNPSHIRIDTPAYRNTFLRDDHDLLIIDRFNPKGVVRIKQVWAAPLAPSIKPALIKFSHSQFQLDQVRELVTANQGIYLPPLRAGSEPLPSVPVQASKDRPLLIDLAPDVQLMPKLNTDGIKLTIQTRNGTMSGKGVASLTVPSYRFAQGSVQVRQLSNNTQASASGYFHLGFDDADDCYNCLSPFRPTYQTVSVAGHDFYVRKANQPDKINYLASSVSKAGLDFYVRTFKTSLKANQPNKINYLASWNNTIGYPVMGKKMLDAFKVTPNTESPYPTLVINRPDPSELQPTYSVFYDVDINALHFEFEKAPRSPGVNVWRGQTLVRRVRVNQNRNTSLNVLLVDNKPKSGRPGRQSRYKVFPFTLSSLKLVAQGNDWVLQSEGYQYPVGIIDDLGLPFFGRLWPSVLRSLSKALPYDGLVFTGGESNEYITTADLATRLEPTLPRLFDSSRQAPANALITGNSLNNIVYIAPEMAICKVLGHSGHDLMLLGGPNKKTDNHCRLNLHGGDGDDIYDLRFSSRPVSVTDRQGRHTVILSSKSRADLKSLFEDKSIRLHITDLEPDQVEFRLRPDSVALSKDSSSESSSNSTARLPSNSTVDTASDLPAHLIVTLIHNQAVLAELPLSALDSLYFKGRKHTSNPAHWIKDRSQPLQQDSIDQQFALTSPEGVVISGQQLASDLKPVSSNDTASSLAQASLPPENQGAARIDLHFQQLVQSLASFNAGAAVSSTLVTDRPLVAGLNMTSPLGNNTQPVLQGGAG